MALIGYARVSSADQSLDIQLAQLQEAGCIRIFSEKKTGTTAKAVERPELALCMAYLREGDVLLVTRLDRLARSSVDLFNLVSELDKRGAVFKCLLQPEVDFSTPVGRMALGMLSVFAQFDNDQRKARQREGIEAAKLRGVYTHKAKPLNGKMALASRYLGQGMTYKEAAEKARVPERSLRRRVPGYNHREPMNGSIRKGVDLELPQQTLPPSAAEAVEAEPTPKPTAPRVGLFGGFLGRS